MQNRSQRSRMDTHSHSGASLKQTHKLEPQTCVVWVPDVPGYVANLGPGIFQVASHPELAYHLTEDEAEDLAMALRIQLGIKAAIRPYYAQAKG